MLAEKVMVREDAIAASSCVENSGGSNKPGRGERSRSLHAKIRDMLRKTLQLLDFFFTRI
jgi:hypothetical protein